MRGVVGLAVARALLQRFPDKSTVLIERHTRPGEETRYLSIVIFVNFEYLARFTGNKQLAQL